MKSTIIHLNPGTESHLLSREGVNSTNDGHDLDHGHSDDHGHDEVDMSKVQVHEVHLCAIDILSSISYNVTMSVSAWLSSSMRLADVIYVPG